MERIPSIFVGHGAPTVVNDSSAAHSFLAELGKKIPVPKAVLCVSAHWGTEKPTVGMTKTPQTIYDFYGFPEELYEIRYHAPGSPDLGSRVRDLLNEAGTPCEENPHRGLDHGAWVPLRLMYPEAKIPVVQLSVAYGYTPEEQFRVGRSLAPLRDEGVLILGSGNATHNLEELGEYAHDIDSASPAWVTEFDEWLETKVLSSEVEELFDYRTLSPHGERNHPTEEHLMPLFVAFGAGGEGCTPRKLHHSFTYGILSMASYSFD
jgi:4,5-DOPA dioxygenase extradiol